MYVDNVDKAIQSLVIEVEKLKKQANDQFPKIMQLHNITNPEICNIWISNAFKTKTYYSSLIDPTTVEQVDKKLEEYRKMFEKDMEKIEETHLLNVPIIENNKKVRETIEVLMKFIGIPSTYTKSYYKTPNSRKLTTETVSAGYQQDLGRLCPTGDNSEGLKVKAKQALQNLERKAQEEKERIQKEIRLKETEEKKKKGVLALARLQVKYGLSEDSEWEDVLDALDNKCKYFALARALEGQRNDWSEGFNRSQNAIDSFEVETEEDKEIYNELYSLAYDEDLSDGRVFRDCTWNYSALYAKVDNELLQDYNTLKQYYGG